MKYLWLLLVIPLMGCAKPLDNDTIIQEIKKCQAAGLRPRQIESSWSRRIMRVDCVLEYSDDGIVICKERGGIPIKSAWDGRLKHCEGID